MLGTVIYGVIIALAALVLVAGFLWLSPVDLELDYRGALGSHRLRVWLLILWGLVRLRALELTLGRPVPSGLRRRLPFRPRTPVRLPSLGPGDRLLDWLAGFLPRNLRRLMAWGRTGYRWWRRARNRHRRRQARGLWGTPLHRMAALGFFGWAPVYARLFQRLLGRAGFRRLTWRTAVGTGDPAETGWAVGSLWAIKAAVGAWAAQTLPPRIRPRLDVIPDFHHRRLWTRLHCIARVRAGDIIYATFRAWREFEARRALQARHELREREMGRSKGADEGA